MRYYGDTVETEAGKFGVLLELHGNISEGFRDIDGSSNDTGFSVARADAQDVLRAEHRAQAAVRGEGWLHLV